MKKLYIICILISFACVNNSHSYEINPVSDLEKDKKNKIYRVENYSMGAQEILQYTGFNTGAINYNSWQVFLDIGIAQKGIPIYNLGTPESRAHPFSLEVEYELAVKFFHTQESPYFNIDVINNGTTIFSKPIYSKEIGAINSQGVPETFEKISFRIDNLLEANAMMPILNINHVFGKYFYIKTVNYKVIKYKN